MQVHPYLVCKWGESGSEVKHFSSHEHQDLRAGWMVQSAPPAACPSPSVLPPCLPLGQLPTPWTRWSSSVWKGGGLGTRHENWLQNLGFPWMLAVANVDNFGKCQGQRRASPGKSCTVSPQHPSLAVRTVIPAGMPMPHTPKGACNRMGTWDFLTNTIRTKEGPVRRRDCFGLNYFSAWWKTGEYRLCPASLVWCLHKMHSDNE